VLRRILFDYVSATFHSFAFPVEKPIRHLRLTTPDNATFLPNLLKQMKAVTTHHGAELVSPWTTTGYTQKVLPARAVSDSNLSATVLSTGLHCVFSCVPVFVMFHPLFGLVHVPFSYAALFDIFGTLMWV